MRKAVAIPYVIALILGLVAISILAYWLISQSSKTTAGGITAECRAKLFSYCLAWQNLNRCGEAGPQGEPAEKILEGCDILHKQSNCKEINLCK